MGRRGTTIGVSTALLIAAVALFVIGAFVSLGEVNLVALGLACLAGSFLVR